MKIPFYRLTLLALPFLPLAQAHAAVNPAVVAADAQWLVYVDLNTLRDSAIGKELLAMAEKAQLDTAAGKVGLDWKKLSATIGSATAYGTTLTPDPKQMDGTLVVQGTPDLRKIAESLLIQANLANPKDVLEVTDLPFPAYAFNAPKGPAPKEGEEAKAPKGGEEPAVIIAFPPEPVVLISKSRAQLLKARDVVRGTAPSLAKNAGSSLAKFAKGSEGAYLFAASTIPAEKLFPEEGPQTRILKMADAGSLAVGERGADTFARAELSASSDAMADKLMKILQGLTAMMSLAETGDKQLADFLNSASVTREGKNVSLSLAYSSARLTQMIKSTQTSGPQDRKPQERVAVRATAGTFGKKLAEWQAEAGPAPAEGSAPTLSWRTIEGVELKNGSIVSLGRTGKNAKFDRLEVTPTDGSAKALTFRADYMRNGGQRGNLQQLQFPGGDGSYTLKVAYVNDPEGKANYAVSVFTVKEGEATPAAAPAQPKP